MLLFVLDAMTGTGWDQESEADTDFGSLMSGFAVALVAAPISSGELGEFVAPAFFSWRPLSR